MSRYVGMREVNGKNGHERFGLEMGMGGGEGEGKLGEWKEWT